MPVYEPARGNPIQIQEGTPLSTIEVIKCIYRDLSNSELLKKCLHGKTQNVIEASNRTIWEWFPKTHIVSKSIVEAAVKNTVACFINGNITRSKVLSNLGIVPWSWCVTTLQKLDKARIHQAEFRVRSSIQQGRRLERRAAESKYYEGKQKEADYGAGKY